MINDIDIAYSCYRHGMTKLREVVITLHCDAAGETTSTDSWIECTACEEENEYFDEELD